MAFGIFCGPPRSSLTSAGRKVAWAGQSTPALNGPEEQAEAVFAAVHVVAEVPARGRVHVGHEDLEEMGLVEHRPPALAVAHVDVREHDARALVRGAPSQAAFSVMAER